jgi:hypothetical protein
MIKLYLLIGALLLIGCIGYCHADSSNTINAATLYNKVDPGFLQYDYEATVMLQSLYWQNKEIIELMKEQNELLREQNAMMRNVTSQSPLGSWRVHVD